MCFSVFISFLTFCGFYKRSLFHFFSLLVLKLYIAFLLFYWLLLIFSTNDCRYLASLISTYPFNSPLFPTSHTAHLSCYYRQTIDSKLQATGQILPATYICIAHELQNDIIFLNDFLIKRRRIVHDIKIAQNSNFHVHKKSFIGTWPLSFVYMLPVAVFTMT